MHRAMKLYKLHKKSMVQVSGLLDQSMDKWCIQILISFVTHTFWLLTSKIKLIKNPYTCQKNRSVLKGLSILNCSEQLILHALYLSNTFNYLSAMPKAASKARNFHFKEIERSPWMHGNKCKVYVKNI